jgi:hypothetical protein
VENKGTIVVRGYRFTITSVRLARGQFILTGTCPGPVGPMENEPVTVFGEDGQGIGQGNGGMGYGLTFAGCKKGETAMITVNMSFDKVK